MPTSPTPLKGSGEGPTTASSNDPAVDDDDAARTFLAELSSRVASDDHPGVADLIAWPVAVRRLGPAIPSEGTPLKIDRASFLEHYDDIMSPCIKALVARAEREEIYPRRFEYFIGIGQLYFRREDPGTAFKVTGIMNDAECPRLRPLASAHP